MYISLKRKPLSGRLRLFRISPGKPSRLGSPLLCMPPCPPSTVAVPGNVPAVQISPPPPPPPTPFWFTLLPPLPPSAESTGAERKCLVLIITDPPPPPPPAPAFRAVLLFAAAPFAVIILPLPTMVSACMITIPPPFPPAEVVGVVR